MNEQFKNLIKTVEEIGSTKNANLTLESKIEEVTQRTSQLDIERVGKDLKEIKAENRALLEKLKQE